MIGGGTRAAAFAAGLAIGAIATLSLIDRIAESPVRHAEAAESIPASRRTAIVTAAQRVSPAVVSVSVISSQLVRGDPFGGVFGNEFWDRFYPQMEYRQKVPGLGSGVIVSADGTILTNEHVVRNAEEISVTLPDGRQLPAQLLGSSATYDFAALKVNARDLPVAPFGDSDRLVVGEWAIAIGNPFGFLINDPQPSITAGVISATHRDVKGDATASGVYKNMIQTDAAINPGNSGGPLVNGDGEVIGINTFIFTQSGGSLGIGFALPINLARRLLGEIKTHGRVRAASPGFQVQPITPYLAKRLGFTDTEGLVITRIDPRGPAGRAGVRPGDRLRSVNGITIRSIDDAQKSIYGASVGDQLKLGLERAGRAIAVAITLAEASAGP